MYTLHVFDFDDTLVSSDSKVAITQEDGTVKYLSSEDYAGYTTKPGEVEDFSDFDGYPKNPEIIEPVFSELRAAIALDGPENVVILTARSNSSPVRLFLNANDIPPITIEAVGTSDPFAKAEYIVSGIMNNQDISEVRVFEDNVRNIRTIRKVLDKEGVILKTRRVKNGKITREYSK